MADLLHTIDSSLQEVEEQLLQELNRIRNSVSESRYKTIDTGIKTALASVIDELHHMLDHSGDQSDLQLQTDQHLNLFARMLVLKRLLDARIPTVFLDEVHENVKTTRRALETQVTKRRKDTSVVIRPDTSSKKIGFFDSLKQIFKGDRSEQETERNTIKVTEQEEKEFEEVDVYRDNGIYSASRELAMLSSRVYQEPEEPEARESGDNKLKKPQQGKAQFGSRDLSQTISQVQKIKPVTAEEEPDIAQSPKAIRDKLASRDSDQLEGKASFGAKDIDHVQATRKAGKKDISKQASKAGKASFGAKEISHIQATQKPAKIDLTSPPTNVGRASFGAKDIEPAMPDEAPKAAKPKTEANPSAGKATFGATDIEPIMPVSQSKQHSKQQPKQQPKKSTKIVMNPNEGKASFGSRDIEPIMPESKPDKQPAKSTQIKMSPNDGKAIFESKDLSSPTNKPQR